jgi:hypothetical protein
LTHDTSPNGTFIGGVESYQYPMYGLGFHPEFDFTEASPADFLGPIRNNESREISKSYINFFINEAKHNSNRKFNYNHLIDKYAMIKRDIDWYPIALEMVNITAYYLTHDFGNNASN